MAPLEIDNPFWNFSLRVYGFRGVAAECLELQDKLGLDVNVVLFAAWLGASRGAVFEAADFDQIERTIANWSAHVVRPLRGVRQGLKSMPEIADPHVQALRKRVSDTELLSEQIQQALLYRLAGDLDMASGMTSETPARANIAAVLVRVGADANVFPLQNLLKASKESTRNDA